MSVLVFLCSVSLLTGCSISLKDIEHKAGDVEITKVAEETEEQTTVNTIVPYLINYGYKLNGAKRDLYENSYDETYGKVMDELAKYCEIYKKFGTAYSIDVVVKIDISKEKPEDVAKKVLENLELEELLGVDNVKEWE